MRFLKFAMALLLHGVCNVLAFGSVVIGGRLCDHYTMQPVTKATASSYVKKIEADAVKKRLPEFVAKELGQAQDLFNSDGSGDMQISFIREEGCLEPDYVIIYRKTGDTPTVYTIDALIVHGDKNVQMSVMVVERILRDFCRENRGYLQTYPLKRWSGGRYANAIMLERSVKHLNE